ncbi:MAG: hypothetical protein FWB78_11360 [Treponema sp.]|nr:hypothetical protein [Treponema sp.]
MTVAELKKMSDEQLGDVFAKMPEPSFRSPINTETKTMEQILDDFSKCEASAEDWAAMHGDVASLV